MMEQKVTIKDLKKAYDELNVSQKRKELGRELAEMSIVLQQLLSSTINSEAPIKPNLEEFYNLYDGTASEDVYLTGLYEDLLTFKELFGIYLDITNKDDHINF